MDAVEKNRDELSDWIEEQLRTNVATEEDKKMLDDIMLVRKAIREKHPEGDKFIQDSIPCPICKKGTVSFMISDHYNGHIHANCSDEECINWME